ncbi:MAG: hypothetical protein FJ255_04605 [Phycisphaerae bacterium]|nr:hypothetical protein [Phycisphaerae bacterium]
METTSLLGGAGGLSQRQPGPSAFGALSAEEFTRIIFSELSRQDPLAPNDTKALLEQLSSIRKIQGDIEQGDRFERLVAQNELASAAGLIGTTVGGISIYNERVEGRVVSVLRAREGAVLKLADGSLMLMRNMDRIEEPTRPGPGPANPPTPRTTPTDPTVSDPAPPEGAAA